MTQPTLPPAAVPHHTRIRRTSEQPNRPWTVTCQHPDCPYTWHTRWHRVARLMATTHANNPA